MNKNPINSLIAIAIAAILWILTAVVFGDKISYTITLNMLSIDDFLLLYRIAVSVAVVLGLANTIYWYIYGNKDSTAGDLDTAKKVWNYSFITQIVIAAIIIFALVMLMMKEGVALTDYLKIFAVLSLHTYLFFWAVTLFFSPITVKFIPLLRR